MLPSRIRISIFGSGYVSISYSKAVNIWQRLRKSFRDNKRSRSSCFHMSDDGMQVDEFYDSTTA